MFCKRLPISSGLFFCCMLAPLSLAAAEVDFAHDIVPIFREHCAECHTGDKKKGGFSLNSRSDLMKGGEKGAAVTPGKNATSVLIKLVTSTDDDERMPPPGPKRAAVSAEELAKLRAWIDAGAQWADGFTFKKPSYDPPLKPRRPELPVAQDGRENPVDRIIDAYVSQNKLTRSARVGDAQFLRRVSMDLIGLLPPPEQLEKFVADPAPDKRAKMVRQLLDNNLDYTEHWLSFWNDLLRNDYAGTGYIDGGRRQISAWLYQSLMANKPYDQFARELIAPSAESDGFAQGIKWRGSVSAGQTVPIQYAQSVGQVFLGINLKCASCHDSFIDRWKLDDSYGLAAVFSPTPIELSRCDKPTGRMATPKWIFPEIGSIDGAQPPAERQKQLAALMTHPENGRFTRTMVNRLWHRLMGRGIVHPVDSMQTEPWSSDLLDFLASNLAENKYDLKRSMELICTSEAYQSGSEKLKSDSDDKAYVFAGPRARRMTAEQFMDAIFQITDTAPAKFDAPIKRVVLEEGGAPETVLAAKWLWSSATADVPAGETIVLRKELDLATAPTRAGAAITCDNSFVLYVNGRKLAEGDNWEEPVPVLLDGQLTKGKNEFVIVAKNGGSSPNPAGLLFEARIKLGTQEIVLAGDETWLWTRSVPDAKGKFKTPPQDWKPAVATNGTVWNGVLPAFKAALSGAAMKAQPMIRASLLKSDLLMRTLGRPNREQIVSMRPTDLATLEAMDLNNGQILNARLGQGALKLLKRGLATDDLVRWLYRFALSRQPTAEELSVAQQALGTKPTPDAIQDFLWAVLMLPEFQIVR